MLPVRKSRSQISHVAKSHSPRHPTPHFRLCSAKALPGRQRPDRFYQFGGTMMSSPLLARVGSTAVFAWRYNMHSAALVRRRFAQSISKLRLRRANFRCRHLRRSSDRVRNRFCRSSVPAICRSHGLFSSNRIHTRRIQIRLRICLPKGRINSGSGRKKRSCSPPLFETLAPNFGSHPN